MPQAVDLVIKDGATTPVDKTFTLITPAAGDGGVAKWVLKEGAISGAFPVITAQAAESVTGKQRTLKVRFKLPSSFVDPATGRTIVTRGGQMNAVFDIPDEMPESSKSHFVAYSTNVLKTALMQAMIRDAYPAT